MRAVGRCAARTERAENLATGHVGGATVTALTVAPPIRARRMSAAVILDGTYTFSASQEAKALTRPHVAEGRCVGGLRDYGMLPLRAASCCSSVEG